MDRNLESYYLPAVMTATGLVTAITGYVLFHQLGGGSFSDWDEAIYAETAREMVQNSNWLTPYWNGHIFFDKPPGIFWLMALGLRLGAWPELAIRLPTAAFGWLTIVLTICLGRMVLGWGAAIIAALLLLMNMPSWSLCFVCQARQGMLDVPLTATFTWALVHLWAGKRDHRHWCWLGLPLGLMVMIKSLQALPLIAIILLFLVALHIDTSITKQQWRALCVGILIALAIALPWHVMEFVRYGALFVHDYVLRHMQKITRVESNNGGDWRFYLRVLGEGLPLWRWLLAPALAFVAWQLVRQRDMRALLLLLWIFMPLVFYTLVPTKLPWYILPLYPALALSVAWLLSTVAPRRMMLQELLIAAMLVMTAVWDVRTVKPENRTGAVKTVGACVVKTTGAEERIGYFDPTPGSHDIRPSVRFYADRSMLRLSTRSEVEQWLAAGGSYIWTTADAMEQTPDRFVVVSQHENQRLLRLVGRPDSPLLTGSALLSDPVSCQMSERL